MKSSLLKFWFSNRDIWFNCSKIEDLYIKDKFIKLFDNSEIEILDNYSYLHYIILYDQITRHIDRVDQTNLRYIYNEEAIKYSTFLVNSGRYKEFEPAEICFILMPLRHTFELSKLNEVSLIIKKLREKEDNADLRRFYYSTIKSISKIKEPKLYITDQIEIPKNILCETCKYDENKETNIKINKIFSDSFRKIKNKNITISLSGGSDSMVCAYILKKMNYDVKAIMIDYNNRESCNLEVKMVSSWCIKMNIPLYVRKIDEISRSRDCDRNFYEEITKNIRFNSYKFLNNPVVLGHNKDDCFENIITNIKKCRSYDNLLGMEFISKNLEVILIRPLLNIPKCEIINFANKNNIPYLYDSTPKWSDRGKIRDNIKNVLDNFDSNLIDNMLDMSNRFKDIFKIFSDLVVKNTTFKIINDNEINVIYLNSYSIDYWNIIFKKLFNEYQCDIVSKKSLKNFIQNLKNKKYDNKIILTKKLYCDIQQNYITFYKI